MPVKSYLLWTHFTPILYFYIPWKCKETRDVLSVLSNNVDPSLGYKSKNSATVCRSSSPHILLYFVTNIGIGNMICTSLRFLVILLFGVKVKFRSWYFQLFAARFLKCVSPFWYIMHERVNSNYNPF